MPPRRRARGSTSPNLIPSPLTTPSILRQILRYTSDKTLATCMQVSHSFYDLASPLLYHELNITIPNLTKLSVGLEIVPIARTTRKTKAVTNLKKDLLSLIKVAEIGFHQDCYYQYTAADVLDRLTNVSTLKFAFHWWCTCREGMHWEICQEECHAYDYQELYRSGLPFRSKTFFDYQCWFVLKFKPQKVVLASIREQNCKAVLWRLNDLLGVASILTIVIPPIIDCVTEKVGKEIHSRLDALDRPPDTVRLILAPLSSRLAILAPIRGYHKPEYRETRTEDLTNFISAAISPRWSTTVYFIEGSYASLAASADEPARPLPPLIAVREGVQATFTQDISQRPLVNYKTRVDYLREGVSDEIEGRELARWREEEVNLAERRQTEEYRSQILAERQASKLDMDLIADELASSGMIRMWLEGWMAENELKQKARRVEHMESLLLELDWNAAFSDLEVVKETQDEHSRAVWETATVQHTCKLVSEERRHHRKAQESAGSTATDEGISAVWLDQYIEEQELEMEQKSWEMARLRSICDQVEIDILESQDFIDTYHIDCLPIQWYCYIPARREVRKEKIDEAEVDAQLEVAVRQDPPGTVIPTLPDINNLAAAKSTCRSWWQRFDFCENASCEWHLFLSKHLERGDCGDPDCLCQEEEEDDDYYSDGEECENEECECHEEGEWLESGKGQTVLAWQLSDMWSADYWQQP